MSTPTGSMTAGTPGTQEEALLCRAHTLKSINAYPWREETNQGAVMFFKNVYYRGRRKCVRAKHNCGAGGRDLVMHAGTRTLVVGQQ